MTVIKGYRYDDEKYDIGSIIQSRGDHIGTLSGSEETVETALRSISPEWQSLRVGSLYLWEDGALAARLWRLGKKKYLYELEVDEADICFKGDLNHFSAAVDADEAGKLFDAELAQYQTGKNAGECWTEPRVEMLVKQARIVQCCAN